MRWTPKRMAGAMGGVALILCGCTGSEVIGTSTGSLNFTVEVVGDAGRYNTASLTVRQVTFRSTDADVDESLSGNPLGLLSFATGVNLNAPGSVQILIGAPPSALEPLNPGVYRVEQVDFSGFTLIDTDPLPQPPTKCTDLIADLSSASARPTMTGLDVLVRIPALGQGGVTMRIDVPTLVNLLENQWVCRATQTCRVGNRDVPPPCLNNFILPSSDQLKTAITFP
jgi:hypothetical protein